MKLECRDAQRMVPDYLAKKLDDKECAAFLSHVKNCPRCMEELETSFMIDYFLRYLDEDTDRSFDIRRLLKENIRKSELRIRRHRLLALLFWILILVLAAVITLIVLVLFFPRLLPHMWDTVLRALTRFF